MPRKKIKKKAIKKKPAKKMSAKKKPAKKTPAKKMPAKKMPAKKKTAAAKRREPARPKSTEMPAGRRSIKPFEVCNYYGVYLREVFEKEHVQNRGARLGEIFERLVSDLHGAWNMVKLYGKDTPLEKLRGEGNPFHHNV